MNETKSTVTLKLSEKIARGLEILNRYSDCTWDVWAEHDIIGFGYAELSLVITKEHADQLIGLGWRCDKSNKSWTIYT